MKHPHPILALSAMLLTAAPALVHGQTVVADSVLQFSNAQGQNGWRYGTWTADLDGYQPAELVQFQPAEWFAGTPPEAGCWWTPPFNAEPWTLICDNRQHSETSPTVWTIRRWVSSFGGVAHLAGHIAKNQNGLGGDGARGIIYVDGVKVYEQTVGPTDTAGFSFAFDTSLAVGSFVDFALDPLLTDALDTTVFTCTISDTALGGPAYGSGCPGTGGFTPALAITGNPKPGSTVSMKVTQGLGGATSVVFLGYTKTALPFGNGCTLNVSPLLPSVIGPYSLSGSGAGNGKLTVTLGIPNNLPPTIFTLQAFSFDSAAPGGIANSNGWELVIQP